jgi:hypothetical protein
MDTHLHRAVGGNTTGDKVKACFCSPARSSPKKHIFVKIILLI